MQNELKKYFKDRGIKNSSLHMTRETKSAAILLEVGFINNSNDNKVFDNRFEEIAQSIAKVVLNQYGKTISNTNNSNNSSCDEIHRVKIDGVQVGAYKNHDSVTNIVKENLGKNIEIK